MKFTRFFVIAILAVVIVGCSSDPGTPVASSPVPATAPAPVSAAPTPTPTPDGWDDLAPGPVERTEISVYRHDRDKEVNERGDRIVYPGDFVVLNVNQFNEKREKCKWVNLPVWKIEDDPGRIIAPRPGQNNPFLFRFDIVGRGRAQITVDVDGKKAEIYLATR